MLCESLSALSKYKGTSYLKAFISVYGWLDRVCKCYFSQRAQCLYVIVNIRISAKPKIIFSHRPQMKFMWIKADFYLFGFSWLFVCVCRVLFCFSNEWSQLWMAPLSFLVTILEQFFERSLEMNYQIYTVEYGRKWTVWQVSCCLAAPIYIFSPCSRVAMAEKTTSQERGIQSKILTDLLFCIHASMPLFITILSDIPYIEISGQVLR